MSDANDKSAAEDERPENEENTGSGAEETPVEGEGAVEDAGGGGEEPAGGDEAGEAPEESGAGGEPPGEAPSAETEDGNEAVTDDIWAEALKEAGETEAGAEPEVAAEPPEEASALADAAEPADFRELTGSGTGALANMDMILDIPVTISVELGRSEMMIKDILQLGQGSVVELEKMAGEAMEILVNGRLVARGEVVMVNEKFGVRLTDIISPSERVKRLA
ncbi:MAG: flagellar motor switch protein FliN [Thermodesulfobacteriota bacterium]